MNWDLLIQLLVNGLIVGMLYGVVAMCFTLIYKSTQVVNFAQGEFLVLGAWICWYFIVKWQLPFVAAFAFALVFTTLFGILVQVVLLRPLVGEPIISVIMVTIGLAIFMQAVMNWAFGNNAARFPNVFSTEKINIAGLNVETAYLMSFVLSLVIMVVFFYFFRYSRLRPGDAGDGLQPAGRAEPRHLGKAGFRDGLGDLGAGVLRRGCRARARQCGLQFARHHRHQGLSGGHRRRAGFDRGRGGQGASSSDCWRTSRNSSMASTCTSATCTRSHRSTCSSSS